MSLLRTSPRGGGAGIRAGKLGRVRAVHNHRSHFGPVLTGSVHTRVAACADFLLVRRGGLAGDRRARATAPPSHTESSESAQVLSSTVPAGTSASQGTHALAPTRLPSSHECGFFSRAFPQSRADDQSASFLSAPARFTAT